MKRGVTHTLGFCVPRLLHPDQDCSRERCFSNLQGFFDRHGLAISQVADTD